MKTRFFCNYIFLHNTARSKQTHNQTLYFYDLSSDQVIKTSDSRIIAGRIRSGRVDNINPVPLFIPTDIQKVIFWLSSLLHYLVVVYLVNNHILNETTALIMTILFLYVSHIVMNIITNRKMDEIKSQSEVLGVIKTQEGASNQCDTDNNAISAEEIRLLLKKEYIEYKELILVLPFVILFLLPVFHLVLLSVNPEYIERNYIITFLFCYTFINTRFIMLMPHDYCRLFIRLNSIENNDLG